MRKYGFLLFITGMSAVVHLHAQEWSVRDSVWLRRVLSGEEKLQLNDATQRAIREGSLISTDPQSEQQMQLSPPELPFTKSFDNIQPSGHQKKSLTELPPSVMLMEGLGIGGTRPSTAPRLESYVPRLQKSLVVVELEWLESATPRKAVVNDPSTIRSGGISFSAEEILEYIFRPSARAKKRNGKHAAAQLYNQYR
ncbi:MAG: hypothetical protein LBJ23_07660 [Tannerella sp.]|jgi:hypothetical protein|nr:hypothetical protein [Tannerella sp.]